MNARRLMALAGLVWLCVLGSALSFSPSAALAARSRVLGGTFGGPGAGDGQLSLLPVYSEGRGRIPGSGLAVNQTTHNVYVADTGNHRIDEFTSAGVFIRAWGANVGGAGVDICTSGCVAGTPEFAPGAFEAPAFVAVDNSGGPSQGDVYVADTGEALVSKFDEEGHLISSWGNNGPVETPNGQLNGPPGEPIGSHEQYISGIGVDPAGNLWVGGHRGILVEFDQTGAAIQSINPGIGEPTGAGMALDTSGEPTIANAGGESGSELTRLSASGENLGVVFAAAIAPTGLAINPSTDELFVDEGSRISAVAPSCEPSASGCAISAAFGVPQLSAGAGLAVEAASNTVLAADTNADRIESFILEPPSSPIVAGESTAEVGVTSANFSAEIDPRGEAGESATEYRFEYGPCASLSTCAASGYDAVVPSTDGSIAPDFEFHTIAAEVRGLQPHTVYHFSVVAHNANGSAEAVEEKTFTTQGVGGELVLPDGRAWEMVSSPDKFGAAIEPITEVGTIQAAADGEAITYLTNAPTEADPQGNSNKVQVLSTRAPGGWSSRDIAVPHNNATGSTQGQGEEYKFFDPGLTNSLVASFGEFNPQLSEEASEGTPFLHSLSTSCGSACYRPLVTGKPGFANVSPEIHFGEDSRCEPHTSGGTGVICGPELIGASEDLGHIVVRSSIALKSEAGLSQLYEWSGGALAWVSVLPDGSPAHGPQLGDRDEAARNAISADGSEVVWGAEGNLYMYYAPDGETISLDKAETGCGLCVSGGGEFDIASTDGSKIFFTDDHQLTANSGAVSSGTIPKNDLYECAIVVTAGKPKCDLSNLTPANGGESADVQGIALGASEDGSWLYFVTNGVIAGTSATPGNCFRSEGECNLYVWHNGVSTLIARLSNADKKDWSTPLSGQPTRVSGNGEWLALMSQQSLAGYDNRDAASARPVAEVYLYDAKANRLMCASCNPTGARPVGVEYITIEPGNGGIAGGPPNLWPASSLVAANVPGWTAIGSGGQAKDRYQDRYLSESGRLFFNSADALVPQDSNGTEDVYEYEPPGVGTCTTASITFSERSGGCVGLISSGSSAQESAFLDASEDGSSVFFLTAAKLSPLDVDASLDVYDARECSVQSPCIPTSSVQTPPCTTEASCKASPTPQPSIFGAPASSTYSSAGNVVTTSPPAKHKSAAQIRAEKLKKALAACKRDKKRSKRQACEKNARRKYGAKAKTKAKQTRENRRSK